MNNDYYLYVIKSDKTGKYHIGSCSDIQTRLEYHNKDWPRFTKTGIPWKLRYFEKYDSKTEA